MARVPRYSRSARVVTQVQPSYTPAAAEQAKMFDTIRQGFDAGVKFMRPAVELEQTQKGEKQAIDAFEKNEFEMRRPFTIADRAFNASGERLVTNRAMIDLDEGFRAALKKADGNIRVLQKELQSLQGKRGELPDIPGLRSRWMETFERGAVTARRQTTALAERRAAAAARQAANDAIAAAEAETERLALTAGSPDDLTAAVAAGVDNIAQFGPRGAFEVNGVEYPADPSRQGIYTPRQVQAAADALSAKSYRLFLEADFMRSDDPGAWADNWTEQVLAGNSPLPPGPSLDLASSFESTARTLESARLREENRLWGELEADLNPYVVAGDAGMLTSVPEDMRTDMRARAEGNPALLERLDSTFAAADAVVTLNAMNPDQRMTYITNQQRLAAADGVITPEEAATIGTLGRHLKAMRQAYTRETTGVSAAEQVLNSGALLEDDVLAAINSDAEASGKPALIEAAAVLTEAQSMLADSRNLSGVQREELLNRLQSTQQELVAQGDADGMLAHIRLSAIEMAQQHLDQLSDLAENNAAAFAGKMGIELEQFDPEGGVANLVSVIAGRVQAVGDAAANYGNDAPVPLTGAEIAAVGETMRQLPNSQRVAIMEQLYDALPRQNAEAVIDKIGSSTPELRAAARISDSAPGAVGTITAGIGVTVQGDTPTIRAQAEASKLAPFLGQLSDTGRKRVMDDAMAYARGRAAEGGLSEILVADIETGIDIALGANDDGAGGIEDVGGFGMAILPTGVTGRELNRAFRRMQPTDGFDLFGGNIVDRYGETFTTAQIIDSVRGFTPDPTDPGRLIPLDMEGNHFMVLTPDGTRTASFSVGDLLGG